MSNEPTFDAAELIGELDAGVFNEKLSRAVRDVAEGALQNEREGKVTVEFRIKRIGEITKATATATASQTTIASRTGIRIASASRRGMICCDRGRQSPVHAPVDAA